MPIWLQAGFCGLVAGGALVVGAAIAWLVPVPRRVVASIMAFGAGVLISALAFDLVDEAETSGGLLPTVARFLGGAVVYLTSWPTSCWPAMVRGTASGPARSRHRRANRREAVPPSPSAPSSTAYPNRSSWASPC